MTLWICTIALAVWLSEPDTPVKVTVVAPDASVLATKVTDCDVPGETRKEFGNALTEEGNPETVTVTAELKPPEAVTETLTRVDPFGTSGTGSGDTAIEKSPAVCGVGASVAVDPVPAPSPQLIRKAKKTGKIGR